jgi:two-component system, NtrC family, sensor kinase
MDKGESMISKKDSQNKSEKIEDTPATVKDIIKQLVNRASSAVGDEKSQLQSDLVNLGEHLQAEISKLRKKDALMIAQSQQTSMEQMVGFMAHQWKQPLNAVNIIVQNLQDAYLYEELDEILINKSTLDVMEQVNFISHSIDDFRSIFIQGKEKMYFDIDAVLSRSAELVQRSFSSLNIQVKLDLQANRQAWGFANEFTQVILNILSNSKDAFRESSIPQNERFVEIHATCDNERCQISISDTAGGIEQVEIASIFEPYITSKDKETSTGLGLFMSRVIIEDGFKGEIAVQNTARGALFTISIPVSTETCR